jgi:hypothetical protein
MAINHELHTRIARRAWPLLVHRAADGQDPFTYGELCDALRVQPHVHPRNARHFLGIIQEHCRQKGLPPLQALAVNKKHHLPGGGYHGSEITPAAHARALKRVRNHSWAPQAPF